MPWAGRVAGIIEAWYPGQEDGNAIAAVLYGDFDPSGKLSLTFPRTATSVPTASQDQWPGVGGRSNYSERLNVGYRWYDATQTDPLFPFGFGLSYTSFQLHHLAISGSAPGVASGAIARGVRVTLDVTNTGKREGAEVVQVYVGQPAENREPPHQLRGFAKVELAPGETKAVDIQLNERSFSIFDLSRHRWIVPAGTYEIFAGTSSRDLPLRCSITIGQRAKDPTGASMYFYNPECHSPAH